MLRIISRFAIALAASSMIQNSSAAADECKDVIKDGTKALSLYKTRFEYRRLLESKLLTMTFQEAKSNTSLTGDIPIGDVLLGVGFDENTFNSYKSSLQSEKLEKVDISRSTDILLSTGDPEILKAWTTCMQTKSGLQMYFSDVHASSAVLNLLWQPAVGVAKVRIKRDYNLPSGVVVVGGKNIIEGKEWIVAGTPQKVQFGFKNAKTTLQLTLNVEKEGGGLAGSSTAYVPSRMTPIQILRPYDFTKGSCDKSGFLAVDAPHHSGTSRVAKFCSDSANGWRFTRASTQVNAWVAIPGQIPGTFANHQELWSGDFQLSVVLGCSNSSGTDIQCQSTTTLQEERWEWEPSEDFSPQK
jgi:hypothetical protein